MSTSGTSEQLAGPTHSVMEIDLDDLSAAYDFRPRGRGDVTRVETSVGSLTGRALDIGGGRGEHASVMADLGMAPVVVDVSPAMCLRARIAGQRAVCAAHEHLPLADDAVDLSYFHLSIHYGDWRRALDEASRVTRPGGRIEIWTFDHAGLRNSALARWFPTVAEVDVTRFPEPSEVVTHLAASCGDVRLEHRPETMERRSADWVEAVEHRFVSTLQLVSDGELAAGIAAFQREYPDPRTTYRYQLNFVRIAATV